MSDGVSIGLGNDFRDRLRQPKLAVKPRHPHARPSAAIQDISLVTAAPPVISPPSPVIAHERPRVTETMPVASVSVPKPIQESLQPPKPQLPVVVKPQPYAKPAEPKQQRSHVLKRGSISLPHPRMKRNTIVKKPLLRLPFQGYSHLQLSMVAMSGFIFFVGLFVSLQTMQTNNRADAQVAALSKKSENSSTKNDNPVPSTVKPSSSAVANYSVAPDLPRYINITKLGVHARVLQSGITSSGAIVTPNNVYDAGWYTGSAKPGQPGATLIDGHVSSWTTRGVFYGIKTLQPGDALQIVRGDGALINYRVVKTQTYDADHVDMQAAVSPVNPGKPGLNLITCGGKVKPGTSEFTQRTIVFAEQL